MNPWKHFHMIEITSLNWVLLFLSGVGAIYRVPSHLNAPTPSHCGDWRRLINWRVLGSPCWLISWTPTDWTHKVGSPSEISKNLVTMFLCSHCSRRIWDLLDVPVPVFIGWSQLLDLRRASSWLAQIIGSTTSSIEFKCLANTKNPWQPSISSAWPGLSTHQSGRHMTHMPFWKFHFEERWSTPVRSNDSSFSLLISFSMDFHLIPRSNIKNYPF